MTSQQPGPAAGRNPRDTVEEILAEVPGSTAAEAEALLALFSAGAPLGAGPLPGEDAAVAAFVAAHPAPVAAARSGKRLGALAALLSVKTAAAAVAFTALGGVALAATTDVLPESLTIDSHKSDSKKDDTPSADVPDQGPADAAAVAQAAKAAAAADRAAARAGKDKAASYSGLCTAFTARGGTDEVAASPAFAVLVAAAPDGDVVAFCSALAQEPTVKDPAKGKAADAREKAADKREAAEKKQAALAEEKAAGERGNGKPDTAAPKERGNVPATNPAAENAGQARADRG